MSPPSSQRPAGVPQSGGNKRHAGIIVLLLVAIAALFMWRTLSNRSEPSPPPVASVPTQPAPVNPKIDDIPPPPPIEEKPEAGPPRIIYVREGGCDGKCSGVATAELGQALQQRATQSRRCYNAELAKDPSLRGHVTVAVRVGNVGNVCSVNVTANDMRTPNVANCAANIFARSGTLPSPRCGCVDATVPLNFVPQGQ